MTPPGNRLADDLPPRSMGRLERPGVVLEHDRGELHLRVLRHQGQALDLRLPVTARAGRVTFAELFAQSPSLESAFQAQSSTLVLECASTRPPVWWLANDADKMICAVNGERLTAGERKRLHEDDTLEVGLTALRVEFANGAAQRNEPGIARTESRQHADAETSPDKPAPKTEKFDLDTLDVGDGGNAEHRPGDLEGLIKDTLGLLSASETGAAINASSCEQTGPPARSAAAAPPSSVSDGGSRKSYDCNDPADPLNQLHSRYLRYLADPLSDDPEHWLSVQGADHHVRQEDPLALHMPQRGDIKTLFDLLEPAPDAESLIQGFTTFTDEDVFASPAPENILLLFAPAEYNGVSESLPSLTRREHHAVSIDSTLEAGYVQDVASPALSAALTPKFPAQPQGKASNP